MDEHSLNRTLSVIRLGGLRYFERTGSTNDVALEWAASGAPDLALVVAKEQTAGRGRGGHHWFTAPGATLAFSLVLKPSSNEDELIPRFSALGALAVCDVLAAQGFHPEIKWPNDVLLNRLKVCGILAESVWTGAEVNNIVLGIGLNIKPESVPPPDQLNYPATCLEAEAPPAKKGFETIEREELLRQTLLAIMYWREQIKTDAFMKSWEKRLAFRGEPVEIWADGKAVRQGQVMGLEPDGSLRLLSPDGQAFSVQFGEVHLRPVV